MSTLTQDQQQAITDYLKDRYIPQGIGTKEAACSIAAINLALTGELTDHTPDCMSSIIGRWIIEVQDAMPDNMRNSVEWRMLLPLAAGTGRDHEKQRLEIILKWMWDVVLPYITPIAKKHGFSDAWSTMLKERTPKAAKAAEAASWAARWAAEAASWAEAEAADAAASWAAAKAAEAASWAARWAAEAASWAEAEAADAAASWAAAKAAEAADAAASRAARAAAWDVFNPAGLLRELVEVNVTCA